MMSDLASFYFTNDSEYEIKGYCADGEFLKSSTHKGLPLVSIEDVIKIFPSANYHVFIAVGYSKLNEIRKNKFNHFKSHQYQLASYLSSKSSFWNESLQVGENVFLMENNVIQPYSSIGDNVLIWVNNMIAHHSVLDSHTTITSHVVMGGGVKIGSSCFIGSNATLRDGIEVAPHTIIGASSNVVRSILKPGLYIGNPALFKSETSAVEL